MNNLRKFLRKQKFVVLVVIVLTQGAVPVRAIEWCHDYVFYVISKGRDSNGITGTDLRKELQARGYGVFKVLTPGTPNESRFLKKGDVVIFYGVSPSGYIVDSHSGVVVDDQGRIDHFLQKYGTTTQRPDNPNPRAITYTPLQVQNEYDEILKTQLVRRGWTIEQIRTFNYNIPGRGLVTTGPGRFAQSKVAIWRPTVDLNIKVLEANTSKEIANADVRVRSISSGAEVYAVLTDANGSTGKLAIPGDKIAQGLQIRAKSKDHKEKWSDVTPGLLKWEEEFSFTVILDPSIDARLYGTWHSPYFNDISVVFRRDGTATYSSKHLNFSNTFKVLTNEELKLSEQGTWIELWVPDRTHRFLFRFRDGKVEFPRPIG